jgi:hypothetical protein
MMVHNWMGKTGYVDISPSEKTLVKEMTKLLLTAYWFHML